MKDKLDLPSGMVWEACDWDGATVGFLVTEQNKIDRPIAFISTMNCTSERALPICQAIADTANTEPWRFANEISIIDLTPYAKPDSIAPMPKFVFSLLLYRVDRLGRTDDECIGVESCPPCRFLYRKLKKRIKKERKHETENNQVSAPRAVAS